MSRSGPSGPHKDRITGFIIAHTGLDKSAVELAVAGLLAFIEHRLTKGRPIILRNFGSFRLKWRKGRVINGIEHRAQWSVRFKASRKVRAKLRHLPGPTP
jgi:nucleoid DNA-binding protein